MHIMLFLSPVISTTIGYLFEKIFFYKRGLEQKVEEKTAFLKTSEENLRKLSEELEIKVLERTKQLQESLHYWKDTFDSMPYSIIIADRQYKILRINKSLSQFLGKAPGEIEGKKCQDIFKTPDNSCPIEKAMRTGNPASIEFFESSTNRHLWIQATPVKHGEIEALIISIVDITELKEKEYLLEKSKDAFLNMLRDMHESYNNLKELFVALISAFVHALDAKSQWTKGHSENVTKYAVMIAKEMGMDTTEIDNLKVAALIHDIGKIGTYDYLLDKSDMLTDEEFKLIQMHPSTAVDILNDIKQLKDILPIIKHHHERYDGTGYPEALKGDEIPIGARILCVADSFDAMTADRPYRQSLGMEYAKSELKRCSGTQFDPEIVDTFLRMIDH
ncbi:MAG: HD domain-containing protein [Nitrospirae bacterium]|nr:HD domain-containing protein [Nitrospirota bacterium]